MSGLLGGSAPSQSYTAPMEASLRISTSAYGLALPIVYGTTRVPGNLMWYGAFTAVPHTTTSTSGGGKGGGGGGTTTQTTYTYTASMMLGLSEGQIQGVGALWRDKQYYATNTLFTIYNGSDTQTAWPYMTSNFPSQALAYRGVAYAAAANYDLGDSSSTPNQSFEVKGIYSASAYNSYDVLPSVILADFLTNAKYGAGFPAAKLGDWTQYYNYTRANGLWFSPAIDSAKPAHEFVTAMAKLTNCGVFYSEGLLKITPYGDVSITANGVTYTPNTTPAYALTDDDYISTGDDPVRVTRGATADAYNQVQVEFINRENQYNVEISEAKDQPNIEAYGLRTLEVIKAHEIADKVVARTCAQLVLQRSIYIRNKYQFRVGARFALLEPTDYVTVTDTALGLDAKPVRILSIEEQDDYTFEITAEDAPSGVGSAATYPSQGSRGYANDYNADPGNTGAPVIFVPPGVITDTGLEIWVAAYGGAAWGGCEVWASYDGVSYRRVGVVTQPGRVGVLSSTLPTGADPDTVNTLAVNMTSHLALQSVSQQDADLAVTLSYVGGELVSYETATLTSADHYNLTYLRRGMYGTTITSHAAGDQFARLDGAVLKIPITSDKSGQTLYLKFPAYNIYGSALQDITTLSPYTYTIPTGLVDNTATETKYDELTADLTVTASGDILTDTLSTPSTTVQVFYAFTVTTAAAGSITVNVNINGVTVKSHPLTVTASGTYSGSGIAFTSNAPASCPVAMAIVDASGISATFKAVTPTQSGTYMNIMASKR